MEYINQIFYEGLGTTVYVPIERLINKNKKRVIITNVIKALYFVIAIIISFTLFYIKFPIKFFN